MASAILILLWVQDELSYDRFHEKADTVEKQPTSFAIAQLNHPIQIQRNGRIGIRDVQLYRGQLSMDKLLEKTGIGVGTGT